MAEIINLTSENFDKAIENGKVLIDFWADWCGPCKILAPLLEELAEKYAGKVQFAKVNVDEERALSERFNIMGIPSVLYFRNGKFVTDAIGVQPAAVYEAMIEPDESSLFSTLAILDNSHKEPETNTALPSERAVDEAKDWVDENKK